MTIETPYILLIVKEEANLLGVKDAVIKAENNSIVSAFQQSQEALSKLATANFHCIIVDYNLPDANGLDVVKQIVKANDQVPVILLLPFEDEDIADLAYMYGVYEVFNMDVISKPVFTNAIRWALKYYDATYKIQNSKKAVAQALKVKGDFLNNMSHEIRTPMNGIMGLTDILSETKLDSQQQELVQLIQQQSEHLLHLLNDILDFSNIQSGKITVEKNPFFFRETIQQVLNEIAPKAIAKQLAFNVQIDETLPQQFVGDARRLQQIIANLASNAVKFTEKGSVEVKINAVSRQSDFYIVDIVITDTGIGIEPGLKEAIFESFNQGNNEKNRKYTGIGLGLSITSILVNSMAGKIMVETTPGKGAMFVVRLPLSVYDAADLANRETNDNSKTGKLSSLHVLIAEDNEINQLQLKYLMKKWDITTSIANNGLEALALLEKEQFNLVLMDIQMPEMDGYTATAAIRKTYNKKRLPVIAMTANAFLIDESKCLEAGMNDYILKPFKQTELYNKLAEFVTINAMAPHVSSIDIDNITPDLKMIKEIADGNEEFEKEMINMFKTIVPPELEKLGNAIEKADYATIRSLSHKLKSSIGMMGLDVLLKPLSIMEAKAKDQIDLDIITQYFKTIESACTNVINKL
jgi:signal transduction histidine kinase/AmiR/NasT family two-component response regulator